MSEIMDELAKMAERAFQARTTLTQVCKRAGVAPSTISRWKAGASKPEDATMAKLVLALSAIEAEAGLS